MPAARKAKRVPTRPPRVVVCAWMPCWSTLFDRRSCPSTPLRASGRDKLRVCLFGSNIGGAHQLAAQHQADLHRVGEFGWGAADDGKSHCSKFFLDDRSEEDLHDRVVESG